jgi:hypothetical protein
MPDGKLTLKVLDVYGNAVGERVDVLLQNQSLSDNRNLRGLDVSKTRVIEGLHVFPNGRYRLEVDALSYHTVSRFVNIPPNGNGEVTVTLPVNPKKVVSAKFPDYAALPQEARALLEASANVANFTGKSGEALYSGLDDLRKAGFLNLTEKAGNTRFLTNPNQPRTVLSYIKELTDLRGDRLFALVPAELHAETVSSVQAQLFHEVSGALHTPPAGFKPAGSYKTLDTFGNLQLSFFSNDDGKFAIDMDIDDAQYFEHIFQVIGNFFGGPTHPYNIHEVLVASQELDPGYRLMIHEATHTVA